MDNPFAVDGFWWLPETPNTRIPGTLSYAPGEVIHLSLMGAINPTNERNIPWPGFIDPNIILGVSSKGQSVTLYRCLQKSGRNNVGDAGVFYATEFIAHYAFFRTHFLSPNAIQFTSISVRFHNLVNWYNNSLIQSNLSETGTEIITFRRPTPIRIHHEDFQIVFDVYESGNHRLNYASISMEPRFTIVGNSNQTFEDYLSMVRLLQDFFTFSITKPTFVIEMNGEINEPIEADGGLVLKGRTINIFYGSVGWQSNTQNVFWVDMLLPFSEVEENLSDLLRAWIDKAKIIEPVYNLYFAGFYRSTYPENEFINLTQAIETYHRSVYGGKYQDDDVFQSGLYKALVAAIPPEIRDDFRNSLKKGRLRFANEYSLRKRIFLLAKHISDNILLPFLMDGKLCSQFAETVANTRNYLTHYSADLKEMAVTRGDELFELNTQLKLILQICLLEELGFPFPEIERLIKRNRINQKYFELEAGTK